MFSASTYPIRPATEIEESALRELRGLVLIGEVDGRLVAAMSMADGRTITNPFQPNANLLAHLRMRAGALRAIQRVPSLRARLREAVQVA
jgi:hypothetical protein